MTHALLGLASCIPVIGCVASAYGAWLYYREGNTALAAACVVDAFRRFGMPPVV